MRVTATWVINAGHTEDVEVDAEGLEPHAVARLVDEAAEGVSVCHQCSGDIEDAELAEVVALSYGGKTYALREDGTWQVVEP